MARPAGAGATPKPVRPNLRHPINIGVAAWWRFHGQAAGANSVIRDISNNDLDLELDGGPSTYGPGTFQGGIYRFENSDTGKKYTIGGASIAGNNTVVRSCVVDTVHLTTNDQDCFINLQLTGTQLDWAFYHDGAADRLYFSYRNDSAVQKDFYCSHVREAYKRYIYAVSSAAGGVSLYINGVPQTVTGTHAGVPFGDGLLNASVHIGGGPNIGTSGHSGWINSLRVWHARALSQEEVFQLWLDPDLGIEGGPIGVQSQAVRSAFCSIY